MARRLNLLEEEKPFHSMFEILEDIQEKADTLPKGVIMRVRGKFAHADKVTANGTLYKKSLWEREAERIKPSLEERSVLMLADHPEKTPEGQTKSPSVNSVVGGLTALSILPGGEVMGEAEFADTEAGRNAAAIVRAGFKLGTSSRARGTFTEAVINEGDPLADGNPEWVGQKVKVVDENFYFKTFDVVVDQSVDGAKIADFQEQEENENMFDIAKLTEEEWKKVLDSDKVKALVEGAVKTKEEGLKKDFEEKVRAEVTKMTEEYLKSDEFAEKFQAPEDDEEDGEEEDPKGKKGKKGKMANFGGKKAPPFEGAEEDARFKALEERLAKTEAENKKLLEEAAKVKEQEKVAAIVEECLKDKSAFVCEKVRKELVGKELREEEAREFVKGRIDLVEAIVKDVGGTVPAGKGVMMGGDREPPKDELTEQQKAVNGQVQMLTSL
jgi:hypothetical protein